MALIRHACSGSQTSASILRLLQWITSGMGVALVAGCVVVAIAGEVGRRADLASFTLASTISNDAVQFDAMPDTSQWSSRRVREFMAASGQLVDEPAAILRIPSLELAVPIYPSASELHLNRGVGVIDGMAPPDRGGNLGLAGHRDGFFRVLKDIAPGALIEVQTRVRLHRYRVASIDVVDASDRRLLAETDDPAITLVTCHPFYYVGDAPRRFIVRGNYVWPSRSGLTHVHL